MFRRQGTSLLPELPELREIKASNVLARLSIPFESPSYSTSSAFCFTMAKKQPYIPPLIGWVYDIVLWTFSVLVDLFFREVHPRGSWKVPRRGPVIIVAAPHANQVCVWESRKSSLLQCIPLTQLSC